tara:strand:+ start:81 stop:602 length:522 start_codon:yes stop_codon:yes gene_type:complete
MSAPNMESVEEIAHYCIEVTTHKDFKLVDARFGQDCDGGRFARKEDFPKDHGRKLAKEELSVSGAYRGMVDEISVGMVKCYPEGHEKHEDQEHVGDWGQSWTWKDFAMSYEDAVKLYAEHVKREGYIYEEPSESDSEVGSCGWELSNCNGLLALVMDRGEKTPFVELHDEGAD